jgi:hypothetical protein
MSKLRKLLAISTIGATLLGIAAMGFGDQPINRGGVVRLGHWGPRPGPHPWPHPTPHRPIVPRNRPPHSLT